MGDALSARGITVSGAQGTLVAEQMLIYQKEWDAFIEAEDNSTVWDEEDNKIYTVGGLTNDKENSFMKFLNTKIKSYE